MLKNGDEVDVDCGGLLCAKCADGKVCRADTDCLNGKCAGGVCISCVDKMKNGGEADIDCGGTSTCVKCADGKTCAANTDCAGTAARRLLHVVHRRQEERRRVGRRLRRRVLRRVREQPICVTTNDCASKICNANVCVAMNCTDTIVNGTETDVDCGGADCKRCTLNQICKVGPDCDSGVCTAGRCAMASCTDGVKNQGESDVDCGGNTTCARCADYRICTAPSDCTTNACTMGFCGTTGCQSFGMSGGYNGCSRTVPVATLPCEDIRTTGTKQSVSDDSSLSVTLPFSFNFFGTPRTTVLLSASGLMTFNGSNPGTPTPACRTARIR
jgi:hypothetical protein